MWRPAPVFFSEEPPPPRVQCGGLSVGGTLRVLAVWTSDLTYGPLRRPGLWVFTRAIGLCPSVRSGLFGHIRAIHLETGSPLV